VKLPKFEHFMESATNKNDSDWASAAAGSRSSCARGAFVRAIELLVELGVCSQTSFLTLDEAIKTTNRRVNALENVVKPWLENTISYIKGEPRRARARGVLPPQEGASLQEAGDGEY